MLWTLWFILCLVVYVMVYYVLCVLFIVRVVVNGIVIVEVVEHDDGAGDDPFLQKFAQRELKFLKAVKHEC